MADVERVLKQLWFWDKKASAYLRTFAVRCRRQAHVQRLGARVWNVLCKTLPGSATRSLPHFRLSLVPTQRNARNARIDIAFILAFWPLRHLRRLRSLRSLRSFHVLLVWAPTFLASSASVASLPAIFARQLRQKVHRALRCVRCMRCFGWKLGFILSGNVYCTFCAS